MNMLFANMGSYDWIIFVMAAVNGAVFAVAERSAKSLYESLLPRIHVSSVRVAEEVETAREKLSDSELLLRWQRAEFFYTLFGNLTPTFTLLGILGTVISLLRLVGAGLDASMETEFLGALTSTFWGIVFTILFRVLDSLVSYHLDLGDRIMESLGIHKPGKDEA